MENGLADPGFCLGFRTCLKTRNMPHSFHKLKYNKKMYFHQKKCNNLFLQKYTLNEDFLS